MIDTRFSTALHVVIRIALNDVENVRSTSSSLSETLNTNPSFVRKLLSPLIAASIVSPSKGNNGGLRLGRPPASISLGEIYRLVTNDKAVWSAREGVSGQCKLTERIALFSQDLCSKAEQTLMDMLDDISVQDSVDELHVRPTASGVEITD
jgi:Rrf2 family transcriptional repressor of oqxAB